MLGAGGIAGGLYVSFLLGDLMMGLGQSPWLWCMAGLAASIPIPFISA